MRTLLGLAEAGCFPGMVFYLSQWLAPRERAAALASLGGIAMVTGVVSGPLAAALMALDGLAGLSGWQWLFLLEGIPAVLVGLCVWRFLPDGPQTARWLSTEEKDWIARHAIPEAVECRPSTALAAVVREPRYWLWGAAFFCANAAGSAIILFRPIMLREMAGLSDALAATLTAVPALVGVAAVVYVGRRATRLDERRWHAAVPLFIGAVGVGLAGVAYGVTAALAVAAIAAVAPAAQPVVFAAVSAMSRSGVSAVAVAFVNTIAAVGAFAGPFALGAMIDREGGLAVACGVAGVLMVVSGCLVAFTRERRARGQVPVPVPA
jgi:MFS family permease